MRSEFDISNPVGLELRAPTRLDRQEHHWNHWGGSNHSVAGAQISGMNQNETAERSKFIVEDDNMCILLACPIIPSGIASIWFNDEFATEEIACISIDPDPVYPTDEDYEDVLMDPGEFDDFNDEMTWMMKSWIFRALIHDAGLLANTRLDSFYNADDAEPLGILTLADEKIGKAADEVSSLYPLGLEILDSLAIIVWIDEELHTLSPDSTALRARRDNATDQLEILQDDRLGLISDANFDRATALGLAATALGSLTTDTDFEEFYRRALLYKVEYMSGGRTALSSGDWEEIQEIATLCTWEGGKAASIAQSLCASARDSIVAPAIICTALTPRSTPEHFSHLADELHVYPNPTKDGWNVLLPAGSVGLRMSDLSGRSLLVKEVGESSYFIPSEAFSPGIYILRVEDVNNRILSTTKIVLQR